MKTLRFYAVLLSIGTVAAILAACGGSQPAAPQLPAALVQQQPSATHSTPISMGGIHYQLVDMGTFGGVSSQQTSLNLSGPLTVVGWSALRRHQNSQSTPFICGGGDNAIKTITHAFRWREGFIVDLSSLAGEKFCSIPASARPNARGWAVGTSEVNQVDPLLGFHQSRPVLWRDDNRTIDLGSFGGYQNEASYINDRGQVVGFSLNTVPDQYSLIDFFFFGNPGGTQTRAFMWQNGRMHDLGTLGTGNDAWAFYINRRSQISGISYTNATPNSTTGVPTLDPFFWDNGKMRDLGTLGGTIGFANAMNDRGVVVGMSNLAGDTTSHAFVWKGAKMIDVGTAGGTQGAAWAVNDAGEVVGWTTTTGDVNYRAFIWKDGHRTDLPPLPGDCGSEAYGIDDGGRVIGNSTACASGLHPSLPCQACNMDKVVIWDHGTTIDVNREVDWQAPLHIAMVGPLSQAGPGVIDDRGFIAGIGTPPGVPRSMAPLKGHAFILIPCQQNNAQSPELDDCRAR